MQASRYQTNFAVYLCIYLYLIYQSPNLFFLVCVDSDWFDPFYTCIHLFAYIALFFVGRQDQTNGGIAFDMVSQPAMSNHFITQAGKQHQIVTT